MATVKPHVPTLRVRSTEEWGFFKIPPTKVVTKTAFGESVSYIPEKLALGKGFKKAMVDYKPVVFEGPPRLNTMSVRSVRGNSTVGELNYVSNRVGYQSTYMSGPIAGLGIGIVPGYNQIVDISAQTGFDTSLAERALQGALAKCNDATLAANEYLVEWAQVLRLLKDPMRTVISFHKTLRKWMHRDSWVYSPRGNQLPGAVLLSFRTRREISVRRASRDLLMEASNRWLQYRYGIAPLVKDIAVVLNRFASGKPVLLPIDKRKARYTVSSSRVVWKAPVSASPYTLDFQYEQEKEEFYSAVQYFRPVAEVSIPYQLGLHPYQFFTIFWNALPFSFVADWAVNVDTWIKSLTLNPYIELCGNCVTHCIKNHNTVSLANAYVTSYGPTAKALSSHSHIGVLNRDEARRELFIPAPKRIYFSMNWSKIKNILTGLALLTGPVLGSKRR